MSDTFRGTVLAFISLIAVSTYTIFGKILLQYISPLSLTLLSQIIAVGILMLAFGAVTEAHKFLTLSGKQKIALVALGLLVSVIGPLLFYHGLKHSSAINAILLAKTQSMLITLFSLFWLKERLTLLQTIGSFTMATGITLIVTEGFGLGVTFAQGDLLIIASCIFYAAGTIIYKQYLADITPELAVMIRNLIGVILLLLMVPFLVTFDPIVLSELNRSFWLYLIGFSIITVIIAQILWYKALHYIPATRASTIMIGSPFFGVFFATFWLHEKIQAFHLLGGLCILFGLGIAIFHHQKHPHHKKGLLFRFWHHH